MSKHTSGPWQWIGRSEYDDTVYRELSPAVITGTVEGNICIYEADARLIASAPELLEALKNIEYILGQIDSVHYKSCSEKIFEVIKTAREAIVKAEGK